LFVLYRHHDAAQFTGNTAGSDLAKLYNGNAGIIPYDAFDSDNYQRNLELLLSQERVVSLIYAKTFPIISKSITGGSGGGDKAAKGAGGTRAAAAARQQQQALAPGATSPTSASAANAAAGGGGAVGSLEEEYAALAQEMDEFGATNRPLTANAILSTMNNRASSAAAAGDKFPPISMSGNNVSAHRMASR
jgi:hypothetical protein